MSVDQELFDAICRGDRNTVVDKVQAAVDANLNIKEILLESMIPAMSEVGERFSRNEVFVPEMLVAARAMQGGLDIIEPFLANSGYETLGKVAIGSVKGDLHDIGKNLVAMMLKGAGFDVEDLGVDCDIEDFEKAADNGAEVLCLSALLTTTMGEMKNVIDKMKSRTNVAFVVGGAVITPEYAQKIGANEFGGDANDAVNAVKRAILTVRAA